MARLTIRLAMEADIPTLRTMQERSLRLLGCSHYTPAQIEAFIARIGTMDDYLVADRTYLVAELAGKIVGCGGWTTRLPGYARHAQSEAHAPDPSRATIRSIFVDPGAARQGVGRRVMNAVENALRAAGFRSAELGATENGRDFYGRLGYEALGVFQVDLGGVGMPFTRMGKTLAPANADGIRPVRMTA
ncbi:MAG: acetyltransferase [Alphaproteobacteria bacterium]|nr:MAG: acetyltransferase [Alphaproteobacteria bacterium]